MHYSLLATLGVLAFVAACSTLSATEAHRDPSAAQCPAFATYNPAALRRTGDPAHNPSVATYDAGARALLDNVPTPAEAANAQTRIRVNVPPSGMWMRDDVATAWKDESGHWWIARRHVDYRAPPPQPIPVPFGVTPAPRPTMAERFPLIVGPADATTNARLDAYLGDPCMNAEPTRFPSELPRRRGGAWVCPLDSSFMVGDIIEPGGRVRVITLSCENELVTSDFLRLVYGGATIEPGREERRTQW